MQERLLQLNATVALSAVDPENPYQYAQVRGRVAEHRTVGADADIDYLAQKYLGEEKYPFRQPGEERVTIVIEPEHVTGVYTRASLACERPPRDVLAGPHPPTCPGASLRSAPTSGDATRRRPATPPAGVRFQGPSAHAPREAAPTRADGRVRLDLADAGAVR